MENFLKGIHIGKHFLYVENEINLLLTTEDESFKELKVKDKIIPLIGQRKNRRHIQKVCFIFCSMYFALLVVYYFYFRSRGDSGLPDNVLWRTENIGEDISGIRGEGFRG